MSYDKSEQEERYPLGASRRRGAGVSSGETAEESGGRSTGFITGFGGGDVPSGGRGGGQSKSGSKGAVIKGSYSKTGNANRVKASARYYTTRENERGEQMERDAFSNDRDRLDRQEIYERLEEADRDRKYHYRMALSPGTDSDAEGVDLKDYTRTVMEEVERQQRGQVSWVAVEHSGDTAHTERAHIHVILSTNETFNQEDFTQLREHATRSWAEAREDSRFLERDHTIGNDIDALSELGERQREEKRERETDLGDAKRTPTRSTEQAEPKREVSAAQDETKTSTADDERELNRNRGRDR